MESSAPNGQLSDKERFSIALYRTRRLAEIGTLTAGVAHELTNPISIITATCNNLLGQVSEDNLNVDQLRHYIEVIDQSAWRCARLVQTLRSYSHSDSVQLETCDLNEIIMEALTLISYQFERRLDIEMATDLDAELEPITCDQNQITQVLINLLTNARDALDNGGGIILVSSWEMTSEDALAFSVRDSGKGINPEVKNKIFDPFFTTKPIGHGTGLGLAIAANIVQQHHGSITAENNPEGGATFTVTLPRRQLE